MRYEPFFPIVRLIYVIPNEKLVVLEFLCYALQYIIPQGEGTSVTRLTIPNFKKIEISNITIEEQEKIGGYLSLIDKEIYNLKKQKELIKEMKRGEIQKLLSG